MDLLTLLSQLATLLPMIEELKVKLAESQVALDEVAKLKYDEGFAAGVASVIIPPVSDKIFSQAEADALVAAAVAPLEARVVELEAKVTELSADIGSQVAAGVAAAMVDFKASLLAKYEEQQVAESESETGFKSLLL